MYVADLNLSEDERHIFIRMVGLRYNTGKKEVKLTAERFPNRIENKRYLTYLLECLVVETKKLAIMQRDGTFPEVLPTILVHDSLI